MSIEMIVSPLLEVLFDQLSSLINREYSLLRGFDKDLKKLSKVLSTIKNVLVDAEDKQINDRRTRDWLSELKDAAYDAEDVLDECEYEALQQETELGNTNCTKQVSESFSACFNFKQILFRRKMGKRIKEVIEKFSEIDADRSKFQLNPGVPAIVDEGLGRNRETSYIITEPKTYGRDEDKNTIIQILLDNSKSSNDLSIYPIVGIGGLGKTTLARLVYNDQEVVNRFDTRIWICVSENFSVQRVTKMIIDFLTEKKCELEDLSPMQNLLKKLLNGKRYLLVLDDVWDDKNGNWKNILMCLLACRAKGSSIIVTTRLPTVVDAITPLPASCVINPTCNLKCLSEDDSWSLFEHYALGVGDKDNEDLVAIGKVVVAKCKGNPLAINVVGSLLNSQQKEGFWRQVRDSEIWELEKHGETRILPALRLSYHHLPPHFRQCFAYCSIYPKDSTMSKERLIHGWMANDFIQCSQGKEVEDVGDDIFNGLLQRHFFEDIHKREYTEAVKYKMHDLLHDLACSVTKNECSNMNISEMDEGSQRVRHVTITCNSSSPPNTLNSLLKFQSYIRTLMFFVITGVNLSGLDLNLSRPTTLKHLRLLDLGGLWNLNSIPSWIGHLRLLKWLDLADTGIASLPEFVCRLTNLQVLVLAQNVRLTELPSLVGKLKNLRYLDLSETSIKVLPESMSTLTNLQTLKLDSCLKLEKLPREMKNMKSLRHLIIYWELNTEVLIRSMPVGIGELTRLETLEVFVVSNASEGAAGIQELGRLSRLKGTLTIQDIRHVHDPRDAEQANLKNKHKLSGLGLYWGRGEDAGTEEEKMRINQVLESLQPHRNIQDLKIHDYPGVELPGWVGNCALTLPNLQYLELYKMPNAAHVLHELPPKLTSLWIASCPKLRLHPELRYPSSITSLSVDASNDSTLRSVEAMPHLSKLQIGGFLNGEETLSGSRLRNLTCLRELTIANCSNVKRLLPKLDNLTETLADLLRILWCDDLDCITEQGLRNLASLQTLTFEGCSGLTSISDSPSSLQHLTSLTRLELVRCPELELLAVDFRHLVALKDLFLEELPQLTSLPDGIQHVTTLQHLVIRECKNLRTLPEWLLQQHLPASLIYLKIRGCHPELHKRCEVDKGEYWHKISHIEVNNIE